MVVESFPQMETKMRNTILIMLGALMISIFGMQGSFAAPHNSRKAVAATSAATQQFRDAFGSAAKTAGTKSCDIFWCYEN